MSAVLRQTLLRLDPRYPRCLLELGDAPSTLRVDGVIPPLDRAVAIVGTRRASCEGFAFVRALAEELARCGCVIVSGGASGIDRAAHEGALAAGRQTVVVLAGGLDRPFPPQNIPIFTQV